MVLAMSSRCFCFLSEQEGRSCARKADGQRCLSSEREGVGCSSRGVGEGRDWGTGSTEYPGKAAGAEWNEAPISTVAFSDVQI